MQATVFKAAAGIGKSVTTAEEISPLRARVEVYVPTHKLAYEWQVTTLKANPHKRVRVIIGRNDQTPNGEPMCHFSTLAEKLSQAGQAVYPNLCRQQSGAGIPATFCPHYENCHYIQQFSPMDEVVIYAHNYLGLERSLLERRMPQFVVIDESFWSTCIETIKIPLDQLRSPLLHRNHRPLCEKLANTLMVGMAEVKAWVRQVTASGALDKAIRALAEQHTITAPGVSNHGIEKAIANALPTRRIKILLEQLRTESQFERDIQSVQFNKDEQLVTVHHRKPITRFTDQRGGFTTPTPTFLLLDASADLRIIERFFHIEELAEIQVHRNAEIIQCDSTSCPSSRFNSNDSDSQNAIAEINALIAREAQRGEVLVVGPSKLTGNENTQQPGLLTGGENVHFAHFNAVRGVDIWKDINTAIIIGRNQPPFHAIENDARALYFDDPEPLLLNQAPIYEDRGYSMRDGSLVGVQVQIHPDPRIQAIMEQKRERESEQTIDRLRLVHHKGQAKKIYLLSNLVLNIEVDQLDSWKNLLGEGDRISIAWQRQSHGVLPLEKNWLAANHPDLWPSAAAAGKDISRKKGQKPISTIGKMSLFSLEYKPTKQKRWSSCLSASNDPQIAQEALQALLGKPVTCRIPKAA